MDRNIRYQVLQEEIDDDEMPDNSSILHGDSNSNNCEEDGDGHGSSETDLLLATRPFTLEQEGASYPPPGGCSHPVGPPPGEDTSMILPPAYEEVSREGGGGQCPLHSAEFLLQQQQGEDLKTHQMTLGDPSCLTPGLPPSYAVATDLPSYEEAERLKRQEEEEGGGGDPHDGMLGVPTLGGCLVHPHHHHHLHHLRGLVDEEHHIHLGEEGVGPADPSGGGSAADRLQGGSAGGMTVGTDWIFFCTFVMSFLFNWLGFLMSLCITNTVAGRCGALAGLGLSMVKWVAIVKHSGFAGDLAAGESWFWWILMLCGFLLFIRGCMQYVNVKYEWKRITGRLHHFYLF